jgi:uncharacterized protein YggT (Ycf19 family)
MTIIDVDPLKSVTQLIIAAQGKSYIDIFKPEGSIFNPPLIYFYTDPVEGFFNLFVVESGATSPVYLPNWLAEIIQLATNQQLTIMFLRDIQEWAYEFLKIFKTLCQMRATLWWWLMFNPYQQPFNTLRVLTEWYLTAFIGIFPVILGIDIGSTIGLGLLGHTVDVLGRLAFTMPYLPGEGEFYKAKDLANIDNPNLAQMLTEYGQDVRIFRNLPDLWYKYPIPNAIREDWYTNRPQITEHLIKNYYGLGVDFLPDRLLKELYEKVNQDSLKMSFNNIEHISTNTVCWLNDILSNSPMHLHF